jgi:cell division protein FtsB
MILIGNVSGYGQPLPEELKKSTLAGQIKYLDEHTRIYENYRAIREDMYRIVSRNTLDTLAKAKTRIRTLERGTAELETQIDSLQNGLLTTQGKLTESIRSKNSISLIGIPLNKHAYNAITWSIIAALAFLLIIGYIAYKANRIITIRTRDDLESLKSEFEAYRQNSRLAREQMARDHFNEIKRLKDNNPSSRSK